MSAASASSQTRRKVWSLHSMNHLRVKRCICCELGAGFAQLGERSRPGSAVQGQLGRTALPSPPGQRNSVNGG